jgi:hypothetical protein
MFLRMHAAIERKRVGGEVLVREAEGAEELDALPHQVDGDGELEAHELARVDAEGREEEGVDIGPTRSKRPTEESWAGRQR